jgi:hypothetical protein
VRWLLVHPPLLGPAVLGPLAAELRSRGNAVRVPDLRSAVVAAAGWWDRVAAAAGGPADVVLGFSGAGVVLPAVAAAAHARVSHGDLTALLYIQGYAASEFAASA